VSGTLQDRAAGAIMGASIGDALGLEPYWYYDLEDLHRDYGPWITGLFKTNDTNVSQDFLSIDLSRSRVFEALIHPSGSTILAPKRNGEAFNGLTDTNPSEKITVDFKDVSIFKKYDIAPGLILGFQNSHKSLHSEEFRGIL
jgi:hypothetical protein